MKKPRSCVLEEKTVDAKKSSSVAASYNDRLHKTLFLNYCESPAETTVREQVICSHGSLRGV